MSRLPTTTASATEYWSSSSRGAYGHSSMSVIRSTFRYRSLYQTFHSSNEMLIVLSLRSTAFTWSAVSTTVSMKASMFTAEARKLPRSPPCS